MLFLNAIASAAITIMIIIMIIIIVIVVLIIIVIIVVVVVIVIIRIIGLTIIVISIIIIVIIIFIFIINRCLFILRRDCFTVSHSVVLSQKPNINDTIISLGVLTESSITVPCQDIIDYSISVKNKSKILLKNIIVFRGYGKSILMNG